MMALYGNTGIPGIANNSLLVNTGTTPGEIS